MVGVGSVGGGAMEVGDDVIGGMTEGGMMLTGVVVEDGSAAAETMEGAWF